MDNTLFLQSEVADPYTLYAAQSVLQPIRWDAGNGIWAVYSHAACREVLSSDVFAIPPASREGLCPSADILLRNLVRLSNPPQHAALREIALRLHRRMQHVKVAPLVARLIARKTRLDWVDAVCRRLPVLLLLKSFGFAEEDVETILPHMEALTKLMVPQRSPDQALAVNTAANEIYPRVERYFAAIGMSFESEADRQACVANLIGLLIQSVDAGRGLLANALLQTLRHVPPAARDLPTLQRAALETLRFDPPIHNTRRIATRDVMLGGQSVRCGETVLVVLAAANRDPAAFSDPDRFDWTRIDASAHLAFGTGIHECVARHFSMQMTAEALWHMFDHYHCVELAEGQLNWALEYEPLVNARLAKQIDIHLR